VAGANLTAEATGGSSGSDASWHVGCMMVLGGTGGIMRPPLEGRGVGGNPWQADLDDLDGDHGEPLRGVMCLTKTSSREEMGNKSCELIFWEY
jgi:hypothetical protein